MKTIKNLLPLFLLATLFLGLSACKKKCVIETEDTNNGSIISGVVFYPPSGSATGNMGGNYVITTGHPYVIQQQLIVVLFMIALLRLMTRIRQLFTKLLLPNVRIVLKNI